VIGPRLKEPSKNDAGVGEAPWRERSNRTREVYSREFGEAIPREADVLRTSRATGTPLQPMTVFCAGESRAKQSSDAFVMFVECRF